MADWSPMAAGLIYLWGIIFAVSIFVFLDWWGYHKERRDKEQPKD